MVVTNSHRTTAIVIKNDGDKVTLVPMSGGKLAAEHLSFDEFRQEWMEISQALDTAMETFLRHVEAQGASREVVTGLNRLQERDRVCGSLF